MGEATVLEREVGSAVSATWLLADEAFPIAFETATQKTQRTLGRLALHSVVELPIELDAESEPNNSTLIATIQKAALGDVEALKNLRTNVVNDMSERVFKAGNQTKVGMQFMGGKLIQNDLRVTDIYQNGLKYTALNEEMVERSKAEITNAFLFEELAEAGVLNDYYAVIFSLAPEDVKTRKDYNFFEDTVSCSIQLLDLNGEQGVLKTALVAGKVAPDSSRHDLKVVRQLAAQNNVHSVPTTAAETVQRVVLIKKTELPNDLDDVIEQYDDIAGGTFYGEAKPRQDYRKYAEFCAHRNAGFKTQVKSVSDQLIAEVHHFKKPIDANKRLDELSEAACVVKASEDTTIQARVFGERAAWRIEQARHYIHSGEIEKANAMIIEAKKYADSGSCPIKFDSMDSLELGLSNNSEEAHDEMDADCKFISKECPKCHEKDVPTVSKRDNKGKRRYYGYGKQCRCVSD